MKEIQELNVEELNIENMIYVVRGKEVMLDSDIAKLFNYETKNLNRQVQRNINRFPYNYCFQLTEEEYKILRFQNGTLKTNGTGHHKKYLLYVFTEHGITMLATILKSGASFKYLGKRCFGINLIEDKNIIKEIIKMIGE